MSYEHAVRRDIERGGSELTKLTFSPHTERRDRHRPRYGIYCGDGTPNTSYVLIISTFTRWIICYACISNEPEYVRRKPTELVE